MIQTKANHLRVFVTGASGFLGGALVRALVRHGAEVHALARPSTDRNVLKDTSVTWHEGDITIRGSLTGLLEGASWVVHASGHLGRAGVPQELYDRVNVEGTRNILAEALAMPRR